MSNPDLVEFVMCFLVNRQFDTQRIWEMWTDCPFVGSVIHTSNMHAQVDLTGFNSCIRVKNEIATSWGSFEIVFAEHELLKTAHTHYPNASHFVLVSQDSIPLVSAAHMQTLCRDTIRQCSMLDWMEPDMDCSFWREHLGDYVFAKQFFVICRRHFDIISPRIDERCRHCMRVAYEGMCNPDEVIIQSLLFEMIKMKEFVPSYVVHAFMHRRKPHATFRSKQWIKDRLPALIRTCASLCHSKHIKIYAIAARKFKTDPSLLQILIDGCVLSAPEEKCASWKKATYLSVQNDDIANSKVRKTMAPLHKRRLFKSGGEQSSLTELRSCSDSQRSAPLVKSTD